MTSANHNPTLEIESAVQDEIRTAVVENLKGIREKLRTLQESLPVPPDRGEDDMDTATELRSVIDCVLVDSIDPAIRDLTAAAAYPRKGRKPSDR